MKLILKEYISPVENIPIKLMNISSLLSNKIYTIDENCK